MSAIHAANLLTVRGTSSTDVLRYTWQSSAYMSRRWSWCGSSPVCLSSPRQVYVTVDLLSYIDSCVAEVTHHYSLADIVVTGDLNQPCDDHVVERTALAHTASPSTDIRAANLLDRVFVSDPQLYDTLRVESSVVKTDHKWSRVTTRPLSCCRAAQAKARCQRQCRPRTPSQNALQPLTWAVTDRA